MADKQVQIRKGTTAANNAFTGALGELSCDTQQNRLRVHDGALAGGYPHALKSEVDAKEPLLGFTPENVANKATDFSTLNNTLYPTTQAVDTLVDAAVAAVTPPFSDSETIIKGSGDPTKLLRFEVDGFTAATTRVLTPPNADATIAGLEVAQTFTLLNTFLGANGGATPSDRVQISNTTAAALNAQQYSPILRFTGQGWKTNAVSASQPVDFRIYCQTVQGSANPTGNLLFDVSVNGAAFANAMSLTSGAALIVTGAVQASNFIVGVGGRFDFATRSRILSSADGLIELFNAAQTGFTRLNFGGTSSSFPALTRNAAILETKLADNSAYATHAALFFQTMTALVALGGGAAPTFGTIGGSGPATAAQNTWLQMKDSTGANFWVPAWK